MGVGFILIIVVIIVAIIRGLIQRKIKQKSRRRVILSTNNLTLRCHLGKR
jgi:hypothetical protein